MKGSRLNFSGCRIEGKQIGLIWTA